MIIPPADIHWFASHFTESSQKMLDAWEDAGRPVIADEPSPDLLCNAMEQLIDLLKILDGGTSYPEEARSTLNDEPDISELGDYGLSILDEFISLSEAFNLPEQIPEWERLSVALSRWIALHEGELSVQSSVVNGLAYIANHNSEPATLEMLYSAMNEIAEATPPPLDDAEAQELIEPWRILIFNRAIVATRIYSPRLMDEAFQDIIEYFPDEAPGFFSEGMEQMDLQGYPEHVREVMQRYASNWPAQRILH